MRLFSIGVLAFLMMTAAPANRAIRLKSRIIHPSTEAPVSLGGHFLVQFRNRPGAETRAELARRGIRVLNAVPESALMVSSDRQPDLSGLDITWTGRLAVPDKLSRELSRSRPVAYLVMFHSDVSADDAREVLRRHGFWILDHPDLLPGHRLVSGSPWSLRALAAEDEVSYILPASIDLIAGRRVRGCAGGLTEAGPVGQYVEMSPGWSKGAGGQVNLHYVFQTLTPKLEENAERNEVARALREWARYANLDFSTIDEITAPRTITILFARGRHSDAYPFDGPGGMLAHTFYPAPPNREPIAGDMHLDADENWQIGSGIDLFSVALHEAGHALGLGHTDRPGSVMYPYYHLLTGLSDDDIAGIRDLYGSPLAAPPGAPAPSPTAPQPPPAPAAPSPPPDPPRIPPSDQTPPALQIISPSFSIMAASASPLTVSGTAASRYGIARITWTSSTGISGTASGTANWSAKIPLLVGTNVVIIRAFDTAGNSAWRAITVVRR